MNRPELITFRAAATLIGVSERTLTRMSERGELTVYWFGTAKRLSTLELLTPKGKPQETKRGTTSSAGAKSTVRFGNFDES